MGKKRKKKTHQLSKILRNFVTLVKKYFSHNVLPRLWYNSLFSLWFFVWFFFPWYFPSGSGTVHEIWSSNTVRFAPFYSSWPISTAETNRSCTGKVESHLLLHPPLHLEEETHRQRSPSAQSFTWYTATTVGHQESILNHEKTPLADIQASPARAREI